MKRNSSFSLSLRVENDTVKRNGNTDYLEREISQNDTLQSIAFEYNITVAELKSFNLMHKDNELHARRVIKIPKRARVLLFEPNFFDSAEENIILDNSPKSHDEIIETVNSTYLLTNNDTNCDINHREECEVHSPLISTSETEPIVAVQSTTPRRPWVEEVGWGRLLIMVLCATLAIPALYLWMTWKHQHNS